MRKLTVHVLEVSRGRSLLQQIHRNGNSHGGGVPCRPIDLSTRTVAHSFQGGRNQLPSLDDARHHPREAMMLSRFSENKGSNK